MKLAMLLINGQPLLHARHGDHYLSVAEIIPYGPRDLLAFIQADVVVRSALEDALGATRGGIGIPVQDAVYLPPLANPGKIICLGLNYRDHATETGFEAPAYPTVFLRASSSLTAHGKDLIRPRVSDQLDYEVELAVVIGKRVRHATKGSALSYVAGYSVFNDASIRDYQMKTGQWTIGKNFDATGAFGPDFVTVDGLPLGARGLRIQTRLNGTVVQEADTSDMIFDIASTIAILSECMTLEPGDVILMGTPSGVGMARQPPLWMQPGDLCECEIEGIGVLANTIVAETAASIQ